MTTLTPSILVEEVGDILRRNSRGYLTAYQILDRLPPQSRDELLEGDDALAIVAQAARLVDDVEYEYLDAKGIGLYLAGKSLASAEEAIPIFRIPSTIAMQGTALVYDQD